MRKGVLLASLAVGLLAGAATAALAEEVTVEMHAISPKGVGNPIGTVTAYDSDNGLVLRANLTELLPGPHGFHVHENGDCGALEKDGKMVAGLAAGGHYDPQGTGVHAGPEGTGHLGDLPVLIVDTSGMAAVTVVAPRLTLDDIRGRALVIHEGGDNFSDTPSPLGGGGARIACGIFE